MDYFRNTYVEQNANSAISLSLARLKPDGLFMRLIARIIVDMNNPLMTRKYFARSQVRTNRFTNNPPPLHPRHFHLALKHREVIQ